MSVPFVGHLDADCFYVSAERVRNRFLSGKPVGVLGNQGACVIAKSYEMKDAGVKTGTPIWDAVRLCPQGVYIKRDFRWYEVLSRAMLAVVKEFSPRVEYYSIDEFFFEVPRGQDPQAAATMIRDRIMEQVAVPVTVGIARSKALAKLISDNAKPFGAPPNPPMGEPKREGRKRKHPNSLRVPSRLRKLRRRSLHLRPVRWLVLPWWPLPISETIREGTRQPRDRLGNPSLPHLLSRGIWLLLAGPNVSLSPSFANSSNDFKSPVCPQSFPDRSRDTRKRRRGEAPEAARASLNRSCASLLEMGRYEPPSWLWLHHHFHIFRNRKRHAGVDEKNQGGLRYPLVPTPRGRSGHDGRRRNEEVLHVGGADYRATVQQARPERPSVASHGRPATNGLQRDGPTVDVRELFGRLGERDQVGRVVGESP